MATSHRISFRMAAAAAALCILTPLAQAGTPGLTGGKREVRSSPGGSARISTPSAPRMNRGTAPSRSYAPQGSRGTSQRGTSYQRGDARHSLAGSPILDALRNGGYGNQRGYDSRYRDSRHREDEVAKAIRTVAIAGAVVGVVGIIANSQQNRAYAPAQTVAVAPAPRGEYVTERILVSQGHYEDVRVWIPETRDPHGRVVSGGYYELRKRWVPEVYEYRPVWIERY